jgi:hypothetical protein
MTHTLEAVSFESKNVGKHFASTKVKVTWQFKYNGKLNQVTLFHSLVTGRRRVYLGSELKTKDAGYIQTSYTYKINFAPELKLYVKIENELVGGFKYQLLFNAVRFEDLPHSGGYTHGLLDSEATGAAAAGDYDVVEVTINGGEAKAHAVITNDAERALRHLQEHGEEESLFGIFLLPTNN